MSTPIKHVAYLSQEIGPRPSGTEEEQQAALYITNQLQKDAHLTASIEDFNCTTNPDLPKIMCYIIAVLMLMLSTIFPVVSIPAAVLSAITAAVLVLETFDKPIVSRFLPVGISQNVVGKYEPVHSPDDTSARRRKVIIVANYDSGKVRHDLAQPMVGIRRMFDIVILAASVVTPAFLLIWGIAFNGVEGLIATGGLIVKVVLALIMLIPVVVFVMEKFAAYNEAANCNASGVAVMLEVARRLGNGEVSFSPIPTGGVMHDEQAAREAGVVPDGASIHYENQASYGDDGDAAVAESAGEKHQATHRVRDIADNLVQVKDAPIPSPDEESLSKVRQDTRAALSSAPVGTLAEAAAKAAVLHEQAEQRAAEEAATQAAYEQVEQVAEGQTAAEISPQEQSRQGEDEKSADIPDWYKKATEKARLKAERAGEPEDVAKYRSRYADLSSDASEDEQGVEVEGENLATINVPSSEDGDAVRETSALSEAVNPDEDKQGLEVEDEHVWGVITAAVEDGSVAAPMQAQPEHSDQPGSTTAMPPLSGAGNLNLDALREAAKHVSLEVPQDNQSASAVSAASTTRLPQMMYYTPPVDRPEEMHARAQKDRITVSTDGMEQAAVMDAAENVPNDSRYDLFSRRAQISEESPLSIPSVSADSVRVPEEEQMLESESLSASARLEQQSFEAQKDDEGNETQIDASEQRVISANIPVVDLPEITLPPIVEPDLQPVSFEDFRQRAPLADVAESNNKDAAKSLLATTLPKIEAEESDPKAAESASTNKSQNVSVTGSFAAVEAIGSQPVGDELIAGVDADEVYVDDADDSAFEEEFTETGAFAGPGYVEMPQSRVGRFFSRFRRKKKDEEKTAQEWLGVDGDFDARSVGKARGGWESFREDDEDWSGGAFGSRRAPAENSADVQSDDFASELEAGETHSEGFLGDDTDVTADDFAAVAAIAASKAEAAGDTSSDNEFGDVQQIYSFAAGDIDTEVWFVALGSELANHGGIRAFLADHASDMRGALIVNLEALGAGELCYLEREGAFKQVGCSPRMKRFIRKASQVSGVEMPGVKVAWRDTPASFAMKHRAQAVTIAGMDGNKPALYCEAKDVIENIDEKALVRAADFVVDLLKSI